MVSARDVRHHPPVAGTDLHQARPAADRARADRRPEVTFSSCPIRTAPPPALCILSSTPSRGGIPAFLQRALPAAGPLSLGRRGLPDRGRVDGRRDRPSRTPTRTGRRVRSDRLVDRRPASPTAGVTPHARYALHHRQPHRQAYEVPDQGRHHPGHGPAADQGGRRRLRADDVRPGLHEHRVVPQRDHLHRRRQGRPGVPRLPDRAAGREEHLPRGRVPAAVRRAADHGPAATAGSRTSRSTRCCTRTSSS